MADNILIGQGSPVPSTSLSELNLNPVETVQSHNASLTGRLELIQDPVTSETLARIGLETNTNPPEQTKPETRDETPEQPGETVERTRKQDLRMKTARKASELLETEDLSIDDKIRLMTAIEKLTSGRKIKTKNGVTGKKSGLFGT